MKAAVLGLCVAVFFGVFLTQSAGAVGLKVAPLEYKATVKENQRLQGFVDVSNPSGRSVTVATSVQGFRQTNNDGGLEFYDDERLTKGIQPELASFELGPREAIRLVFAIDGNTLPEGDVFAAMFFTINPSQPQAGVGQSVRVGTLFSLVNKTPGSREGVITGFSASLVQLSESASLSVTSKNTGPKESGFYPQIQLSSWPTKQTKQFNGVLVFGGRERQTDTTMNLGYGIHRIEASLGKSTRVQWVVLIAPWMLITAILVLLVVVIEIALFRKRRKTGAKHHPKIPKLTPEK